jgi:HME family heavy-metal exporter
VFIPVFALSSIEGRLFAPLGIAYIVSILASLVVSLTVTPVLSYYLLPQAKATHQSRDGLLLRVLKRGAAYLIRVSMSHTGAILIAGWILALLCGYLFYFHMGFSFLPAFDEGSVQVNLSLPAGSSLEQSNEMGRIADRYFQTLQKTPQNPKGFILKFVRRTGRAELDEHAEPVSNSEYILTIDPQSGRSREDVLEQLLKVRDELPKGVDVMAEQPLQHTISHMLSGASTQIVIRVFGDDLDRLEQLAGNIKEAIKDIQGITEPVVEAQQKIEELHIYPKSDVLLYYGVDREHIAAFVQTAYQGKAVTQIIDGERRIDVVVRLDTPGRPSLATLRRLMVDVPAAAGSDVPRRVELETLARVEEGRGPNAVGRDNVQRRIDVRVNTTAGRDLSSAVEEIKQRVAERVKLPDGYSLYYGGQFESQVRATRMISILVVVAVIGMFVVLLMLYPSPRIVLQILNALPMAFIGGVAALMVTGQTPTVAALVGFISLAGIAARNGILLVSHYFHLMKYEGEGFTQEMVMRGSLERLAPVLMTALTAGIALIPLVVGGHQPGREILYPVATVILGGLITSTLCEYLLHPGLFWRFSGKDAERVVQAMEIETELAKKETTPAVVAPAGHSKH